MRRPFAKLMELLDREFPEDATIGDLAREYEEDPGRIMDAIDALKVYHGQIGYL